LLRCFYIASMLKKLKQQKGFWIGIGIMVGSVVGALTDNIVGI